MSLITAHFSEFKMTESTLDLVIILQILDILDSDLLESAK